MKGRPSLPPSRPAAIAQAVLVTFLWSTSWVLIVIGLRGSLPALTFAGMRYALAFLCLLPLMLARTAGRAAAARLTRGQWGQLALLGLLVYAFTQGAQFVSLALLPANTVSLMLNLTPVVVALGGGALTGEKPSLRQWWGIAVATAGVLVYFVPLVGPGTTAGSLAATAGLAAAGGLAAAALCVLGNAASSAFGRVVNHESGLAPLVVTTVSMGYGAAALLAAGVVTQGFVPPTPTQWVIIAWLAVVNTAFTFTLWNNTLRTLSAVESSVINSLMLPQTVLLAVIFLGESLNIGQAAGLLLVGAGVLVVQLAGVEEKGLSLGARSGDRHV